MKTEKNNSYPDKQKTDRRVRKTKDAIHMAFAKEMSAGDDPCAISVTKLCNTADINRKTFYYHYTCVEDVLNEIIDDIVGAYMLDISERAKNTSRSNLFSHVTELVDRNIEFYMVLFSVNVQHAFFKHLLNSLKEATLEYFCGEQRLDPDVVHDTTLFIISGTTSIFNVWFNSDHSRDILKLTQNASMLAATCLDTLLD